MTVGTQPAALEPTDDWQTITFTRIAAPPLRFSARCIDAIEEQHDGGNLFFALFERKKGGFGVTVPGLSNGKWAQEAFVCKSGPQVLSEVEAHCEKLKASIDGVFDMSEKDPDLLSSSLIEHCKARADLDQVLFLAGRALYRWEKLLETQDFQKRGL